MKKIRLTVALLLLLSILTGSLFQAAADTQELKSSDIDVFQFVQRFAYNIKEFSDIYKIESTEDIYFSYSIASPMSTGLNFISGPFGFAMFDGDYKLTSVSCELYDYEDHSEDKPLSHVKCIVLISVLEFNEIDQKYAPKFYDMGIGDTPNIYVPSEEILRNIIKTYNRNWKKVSSGEQLMVYNGETFDYYLSYSENVSEKTGEKKRHLDLICRPR